MARSEYEAAVNIYRTVQPEFQQLSAAPLNPLATQAR